MLGIIISILILGLIILIHEGGHFIVAKMFKVPVREFSLGMGPRIFSTIKGKTRYSIKIMPFGGSCAMIGEDISGSGDFTNDGGVEIEDGKIDFDGVIFTKEEIEKNNFSKIKPWKKALICLAGPFFNFILGLLCAVFLIIIIGVDKPIITQISDDGAAKNAMPYNMQLNDEIVYIETPTERQNIVTSKDLIIFMTLNNNDILSLDQPIVIEFKRNNETKRTMLSPKNEDNNAKIGIALGAIYHPTNILEFSKYVWHEFMFYIDITLKSIIWLLKGKVSVNEVSGPVGTVAIMGQSISSVRTNIMATVVMILSLIEMISVNLGIMNLIPIPALDGGRFVESLVEMITGKPINPKIEGLINTIAMILLLIFMFYIMGLDIYKIFTGAFKF